MYIVPKSFLAMLVEVNEKAPTLWGCKEGDGEFPLLKQHDWKELYQNNWAV